MKEVFFCARFLLIRGLANSSSRKVCLDADEIEFYDGIVFFLLQVESDNRGRMGYFREAVLSKCSVLSTPITTLPPSPKSI